MPMRLFHGAWIFLLWGVGVLLVACPGDPRAEKTPCNVSSECSDGEVCFKGFCELDTGNGSESTPDSGPPDAGMPMDAGHPPDAGPPPDGGEPTDAASPGDAALLTDAGSVIDGSMAGDAGRVAEAGNGSPQDGGPASNADSGATSFVDASTPNDAGGLPPDAGLPAVDGGPMPDGGASALDASNPPADAGPLLPQFQFSHVPLMEGGSMEELASGVDTVSGETVTYALALHNGLFRRTTSESSWSECPPTFEDIDTVEVAPDNADQVFIEGNDDDIFVSNDGCQSFFPMGLFRDCDELVALGSSEVWAGCDDGIWKYQGGLWTAVPSPLSGLDVQNLALSADGQTIVAGSSGAGLVHSFNGGSSFSNNTMGLPDIQVSDVQVHPTRTSEIWVYVDAGLYRLQALSSTFEQRRSGDGNRFEFSPHVEDRLLAYFWGDLLRSNNAGSTWSGERRDNGAQEHSVSDLVFDPQTQERMMVATRGGIYLSDSDDFQNWQQHHQGLQTQAIRSVLHDESGRLWVCADDGVYLRPDVDSDWIQVPDATESGDRSCHDLWVSDVEPDRILVMGGSIRRSNNGGASFSERLDATSDDGWDFVSVVGRGNQVVVGTDKRLHRSSNSGDGYEPVLINGMEHRVRDLALAPSPSGTLLVATDDGLFETDLALSFSNNVSGGILLSDVRTVSIAADGTWVVSTSDGLQARAPGEFVFGPAVDPPCGIDDTVAMGEGVIAACEDGLFFWDLQSETVSAIANSPILPHETVVLDAAGKLWMGTLGRGLWLGEPIP
jgi:photosystem II stability/assembly factor-like uncharacterized protein